LPAVLAPLRYLNERAGSIYAGSNEIQRNILAKTVLGMNVEFAGSRRDQAGSWSVSGSSGAGGLAQL
jgi:hypothetical protein